jgi:hypothetical protein
MPRNRYTRLIHDQEQRIHLEREEEYAELQDELHHEWDDLFRNRDGEHVCATGCFLEKLDHELRTAWGDDTGGDCP